MSAAPGTEFPVPCPVCGSTDEHAEFRARSNGMGCTFCPHPAQPGHGTGCCCAGRSKPLHAYSLTELGLSSPSSLPNLLDPETIRQLLRESVTVVRSGEVLLLCAQEGWTPAQVRDVQEVIAMWLEDNAPEVKALVIPPFEIAIVPREVASGAA